MAAAMPMSMRAVTRRKAGAPRAAATTAFNRQLARMPMAIAAAAVAGASTATPRRRHRDRQGVDVGEAEERRPEQQSAVAEDARPRRRPRRARPERAPPSAGPGRAAADWPAVQAAATIRPAFSTTKRQGHGADDERRRQIRQQQPRDARFNTAAAISTRGNSIVQAAMAPMASGAASVGFAAAESRERKRDVRRRDQAAEQACQRIAVCGAERCGEPDTRRSSVP